MFKMTNPDQSEARVTAAWIQANGDQVKAQAFLQDRNWSPVVGTPKPEADKEVGRVKEIDEANKAQRAAVKEKGKHSAIYANRLALETGGVSTPPTSRAAPDSAAACVR